MACRNAYKVSQYVMAVLLIVSSIAIAIYQVVVIMDVAAGVRWYIAQAFLLAGSIFGLDYYVKLINDKLHAPKADTQEKGTASRNPEQQPVEHPNR